MVRSTEVVRTLCLDKGVAVGPRTARQVVETMLSPQALLDDLRCEVRGRDPAMGLVTTVILRSTEIRDAIRRARPGVAHAAD